jgi:hypothetical protein
MFFIDERHHFFKPLASKYREQVVQCLCLLYQRQFSSTADYGHALNRDQLVEILEEALARAPELDAEDDEKEQRFKTLREHANWILKQLIECGWIERQVDAATLQSTFPFSRMGRVFSLALLESDSTQIRTRHRNTRNTLNSLEAFVSRGEVYDLLDAYEYSERIITDFTDVISELEERKRELVREVESQQLVQQATDQFFEFMEKRFQPDISVRLSADSVEKHRDQISRAIAKIRKKDKAFKQGIERELRRTMPDLYQHGQSVLWLILDTIENRMRNAAEIMLPALRRSLHGFTKRADIIIRQLTYLNSQQNNNLLDVCRELSELGDEEYNRRMVLASDALATIRLHLIDPAQIRLAERQLKQAVDTAIARHQELNIEVHRELMIQQMLDQAFVINNQSLKDYVAGALRQGRKISTRDLPINDAKDLLAMAHVIEAGAVSSLSSEMQFIVTPTGRKVTNSPYYHEFDEFTIELQKTSTTTNANEKTA